MDTRPFTIASNKIKYVAINLTKEVKEVYNENFKPLQSKIQKDTRKQKDIPLSRIGRISILKMNILPKPIYRFSANSIKIPISIFKEIEKNYAKIYI